MIVGIVAPMVDPMFVPDRIPILGAFLFGFLGGLYLQIVWFVASFFLWVVLTVWCCLVIHGDQRRKEIEQLINAIKVDSGKSLHQETQQANEANKTMVFGYHLSHWSSCFSCFFHQKRTPIKP